VFMATYGDDEPLRMYNPTVRPQTFPRRYQVVVYGILPERPTLVVNQSRDDVQLVKAAIAGATAIDPTRCQAGEAQSLDCTEELQRSAGAPSLERVIVPEGYDFAGCQVLRVTTVAKTAALPGAVGIGFYSAETTSGQFSADHGRLVPRDTLKSVGNAVLKNGAQAKLHEFVGLVNCSAGPGATTGKLLKPYMDFLGGPPKTIYRNWDPFAGNYSLGGPVGEIDRSQEVLQ
jgi:hypothetical protein